MSTNSALSSALRLTDLDDYLGPSVECIKPAPLPSASQEPDDEQKGGRKPRGQIQFEGETASSLKAKPAKITLNDCLACSGCITSAETVLVTAQSVDEWLSQHDKHKYTVVTVSPQVRASLAVRFGISGDQVQRRLAKVFHERFGVHAVLDSNWGRLISWLELRAEISSRINECQKGPQHCNLPLLSGACPGWVCYAEKSVSGSLPSVLDLMSAVRSPQAIMGIVVKQVLPYLFDKGDDIHSVEDVYRLLENFQVSDADADVYHCTIMPCFDKKLEAVRPQFEGEVGCVLSAGEIELLLDQYGISLETVEPEAALRPIEQAFSLLSALKSGETAEALHSLLEADVGGLGSGGYADVCFHHIAETLSRERLSFPLSYAEPKRKNQDWKEYTLTLSSGATVKGVCAYGFRNIQNLVRRLKTLDDHSKTLESLPYHFVEVMACPSGCLNGGGQIRLDAKDQISEVRDRYREGILEEAFEVMRDPFAVKSVELIYRKVVGGMPGSSAAKEWMCTSFVVFEDAKESTDSANASSSAGLNVKW